MDRRVLGVVLAGGESRRFGAPKALALLAERPLIQHVADRLATQVDAVAISGMKHAGYTMIDDRPAPGLGPLGGLCGALCFARDHGFDLVMTSACDLPHLPLDLAERLGTYAPAVLRDQYTVGLWPVGLAALLDAHLKQTHDRSIRGWLRVSGAAEVAAPPIANVNTPHDLNLLTKSGAGASAPAPVGHPWGG